MKTVVWLSSVLVFVVLSIASCASLDRSADLGIKMTPEEAANCKQFGCSAWTEEELAALIKIIYTKGYAAGRGSI